MTQVAVVFHAQKLAALHGEDPRSLLGAAIQARGWPEARWYSTSEDDPGAGAARRALDDGAELVLACGGDGTANACASTLAGSGVPMALIPAGTGNIIAANLGIPTDPAEAVRVALTGRDRTIDVGRIGDGSIGRRAGAAAEGKAGGTVGGTAGDVMVGFAGTGLDAAMVQDAPHWLKSRVGWLSYVASLVRHLTDGGFGVVVNVDGRRTRHHMVRTVVIGNLGALQGGMVLFPEAEPEDGLLEVAVIAPKTVIQWIAVVADLVTRRPIPTDAVRRYRGRRVVITGRRPLRRETDGEPLPDGMALDVRVEPGALRIRVDSDSDAGGDVDAGGDTDIDGAVDVEGNADLDVEGENKTEEIRLSQRDVAPPPGVKGGHQVSKGDDRP